MQTKTHTAHPQPPKHTQFQKGKSGNPRGRPKGSRNLSALLKEALEQRIDQDGQAMTKLEAALKQIADNAAAGNPRILQMLLGELRRLEASSAVTEPHDCMEVARANMEDAQEQFRVKMSKLRQELYNSPDRTCPACGGVAHGPRKNPLFWEN